MMESAKASSDAESATADAFAAATANLRAQRPIRSVRLRRIVSNLQELDIPDAERELREYIARYPDDADALSLLANLLALSRRNREAALLLERCLDIAPDFAAARFSYARVLSQLNEFEAALRELDRLLAADSENPLFRQMKANVLETIGENEQSLAICEQLVTENPSRAASWISYGHALRAMGAREESAAAYRNAYWSLANMKAVRFSNDDIAAMQEHLKRTDIPSDDRVLLQFSLGKAYEDLGDYARSWEQYAKGNATARLRIEYDSDAMSSRVAVNKRLFTSEFFKSRYGVGCKAPDPIFVVGRPRSGSTLIEQILSSHSAIEGAGELPYIPALASRLKECDAPTYGADYPELLAKLDPAGFEAMGEEYLNKAKVHRKLVRPFFTDKKPPNSFHIGLLHLILPNAKIIDARRHPAACCLSMYRQHFSTTNLRLTELGRGYRDYVELMAHFDRVLPGKIHRVIYEDTVRNAEAEVRKLLDYLNLPFEENCLRFYETKRMVHTPSSEQVRRPISDEAVDHWRHYEPWLGPLIESLGSVFTCYPEVPRELR